MDENLQKKQVGKNRIMETPNCTWKRSVPSAFEHQDKKKN